jgi:large subunit ribosomal protein L10
MPTPQKTEIINDLTQKFQSSSGIYFTRYYGMNVIKITELRRKKLENEVSYFVSKNTLTKIAAHNAGYEDKLNNLLNGQIGIAYVSGDAAAPARVIRNFEKGNKGATLEVIGLVYEGELFSAEKNTNPITSKVAPLFPFSKLRITRAGAAASPET